MCERPCKRCISHDVRSHTPLAHEVEDGSSTICIADLRASIEHAAEHHDVGGNLPLVLHSLQVVQRRRDIVGLRARADHRAETVRVRLHAPLEHDLMPVTRSRGVPGFGASVDHRAIADYVGLDTGLRHPLHPLFRALDVAKLGAGVHNSGVRRHARREAPLLNRRHPPLRSVKVALLPTAIDQRVVAHDVRLDARGDHLLEPLLSLREVPELGSRVDDGGEAHLVRGGRPGVEHPLEPALRGVGAVGLGACVHHDVVADGVGLHARQAHLRVPSLGGADVAALGADVDDGVVARGVGAEAGELHVVQKLLGLLLIVFANGGGNRRIPLRKRVGGPKRLRPRRGDPVLRDRRRKRAGLQRAPFAERRHVHGSARRGTIGTGGLAAATFSLHRLRVHALHRAASSDANADGGHEHADEHGADLPGEGVEAAAAGFQSYAVEGAAQWRGARGGVRPAASRRGLLQPIVDAEDKHGQSCDEGDGA
mmetsp:Transcript_34227/g.97239  ORF Transcript_34227/g.97239 Transcript_34227/m.97239 type:complete len:482 (+) Transcript_34227:440-1885(+)